MKSEWSLIFAMKNLISYSKGAVTLLVILIMAGCSKSPEEAAYQAAKCAGVAEMLVEQDGARVAGRTAKELAARLSKASQMKLGMMIAERMRDEFEGVDQKEAFVRLQKIYASSECQKLYVDSRVGTDSEGVSGAMLGKESPSPEMLGANVTGVDTVNAGIDTPVGQGNSFQESEGDGANLGNMSALDDEVVGNAIAITASSEMGEEHKEARHMLTSDLNGDGVSDAVALFTIEVGSGNRVAQYLSVFTRQANGVLRFVDTSPVGGTGGDAIDGVGIVNGSIKLKTLTRGPDDPDCCPSVSGEKEFLLHNGKLKQVF